MERLVRLRVPLTVAALVGLSLVVLARVVLGLSELGPTGSRAVAAARLAPNGSDGALTLLAGVLVVSCCLRPEAPGRRRFAVWGVALTAALVVASVVALALTSLQTAGWSVVWLVPDLLVPVLVGVGLVAVARHESRPAPVTEPVVPASVEPELEPAPDPALEPTWTTDTASGAVWRTAGEAASGAPALGWGRPEGSPWALPAGRDEPDEPDGS